MKNEEKFYGYSREEYKVFKKQGIKYLILFSLLYCFHYCTRLNLGNASAVMLKELNWTTADIGILTSTLFWTYGLGQLVNGRLSEIVGPYRFVILGVLLSALTNIVFGLQSSLVVMAIVWGLNGFFQSMAWTPGLATLTKWWPGNTRGFATGFANAFSGFGQAIATLVVAFSLNAFPQLGWRAAFIVAAFFPIAMLLIYVLFSKPSPKYIGMKEYTEDDPVKAAQEAEMKKIVEEKGKLYPYKYILSNKRFLVWLLVAFAVGLARYGLVTWIPLYFIQVHDVDVTAGLLQSLALPVGMGIGTLVVPWLTDRFCPNNRLPAVVLSALGGAISVLTFLFLKPGIAVEVMLFVAGFCIYAINGTAWAYTTDLGGRVFAGTASGTLNCVAYLGATVQSNMYGFLLEEGGWGIVFGSIAGFCVLIAVLGLVSLKKEK